MLAGEKFSRHPLVEPFKFVDVIYKILSENLFILHASYWVKRSAIFNFRPLATAMQEHRLAVWHYSGVTFRTSITWANTLKPFHGILEYIEE